MDSIRYGASGVAGRMGLNGPLALAGGLIGAGTAAEGAVLSTALTGATLGGLAGMATGIGMPKAPKISAPPPRSYLAEMQDTLKSQAGIQGSLLGLEAQYTPQYQQLQRNTLMGQMGVLGDVYGSALPVSEQLQASILAQQGSLYPYLGQYSQNAYNASLDPSIRGLLGTMGTEAQAGLEAGTALTPEAMQQAQQSARAAMSARGLAGSNQGIATEVLNSYNLGQARQDRARLYAQNVLGLGANQAQQAYGMYGQPILQQMASVSPTSLYGLAGTGSQMLGTKIFQPESQYAAGVYGGNIQNQMSTQLANAQIAASQQAGQMSMLGSLGSGLLMGAGQAGGFGNLFRTTPTPIAGNSYGGMASAVNYGYPVV